MQAYTFNFFQKLLIFFSLGMSMAIGLDPVSVDIEENSSGNYENEPCIDVYINLSCESCILHSVPLLHWAKEEDINLNVIPCTFFVPAAIVRAKGYYIAKEFDKESLYLTECFSHYVVEDLDLDTEEDLRDFLYNKIGLSYEEIDSKMDNIYIAHQLQKDAHASLKHKVIAFPTIIVHNKYVVQPYDFDSIEELKSNLTKIYHAPTPSSST